MQRRWRDDLRSDDANNRADALFEIIAAGLFHDADHPVTVAKLANKGFDFQVSLDSGKRLRCSCKCLQPSDYERNFARFARRVRDGAAAVLPRGSQCTIGLFAIRDEEVTFRAHEVLAAIAHAAAGSTHSPDFRVPGWVVQLRPLAPLAKADFWSGHPSFTLFAIAPHTSAESHRFQKRVDRALENLAKHCSDVWAEESNLLVMKVPSSVRMTDAREHVTRRLANHPHTSAAYLYRVSWVTNDRGLNYSVAHEFVEIKNAMAKVALETLMPTQGLHLAMPIGIQQQEEPWQEVVFGDEVERIHDSYVHVLGHHWYESDVDETPTVSFVRRAGVTISWSFRKADGHHERLISESPEAEFVLL